MPNGCEEEPHGGRQGEEPSYGGGHGEGEVEEGYGDVCGEEQHGILALE